MWARVGLGLMTALSVAVGGYALFHVATGFSHVPPAVLANGFPNPWALRVHIACSGLALITGPWQFWSGVRARRRVLHRWTGRVYVLACLVGGVAGGLIALRSSAGPIAGWGFLILALLWVPFTAAGWAAARRRDFVAHARWMSRSFALTFGAVILRVYVPIGVLTLGYQASYPLIAWVAWVPNLLLVELWLRRRRLPVRSASPALG